jgi:hypothetical protein
MHILDEKNNKKLDTIIIYLNIDEANELYTSLKNLINNPDDHAHISNDNYTKEVTVCIYNKDDLSKFDERSQKIIRQDI